MKVLINGTGNIGTTLASLLADFKETFEITEIFVYKNIIQNWKMEDLFFLEQKGIKVLFSKDLSLKEVIKKVDYVFEATANGIGNKNKEIYLNNENFNFR